MTAILKFLYFSPNLYFGYLNKNVARAMLGLSGTLFVNLTSYNLDLGKPLAFHCIGYWHHIVAFVPVCVTPTLLANILRTVLATFMKPCRIVH